MKHYVEPDGHRFIVKAAETIQNVFVKVPPMKSGDKIDLGVAGSFTYDPAAPSPVFKVNQVKQEKAKSSSSDDTADVTKSKDQSNFFQKLINLFIFWKK